MILTGVTNHIFDKCNEASEKNLVYDWACSKAIVPKKYGGEGLNGPNSQKLLKNSNELTELLPENLKPYGYALQQLNGVVEACFGKVLMEDVYKERIKKFETTYRLLPHGKDEEKELSVTTKAHVIFEHVVQQIERTGQALGIFSEQAFESVHYDFLETWKRFKVTPEHKEYGQKLLAAVVNYNSFHISDN